MLRPIFLGLFVLSATVLQAGEPWSLASSEPVAEASLSVGGRSLDAKWLPAGEVKLGQAAFDTAGGKAAVVRSASADKRTLVTLAAPQLARQIAFLHTYVPGPALADYRVAVAQAHRNLELPPVAPTLFTYEIVYADGVKVDFPIRWGESIEDAYRVQDLAPLLWARENWQQPIDAAAREWFVSYAAVWPNPRPEVAVAEVRLRPNSDRWNDYGVALISAIAPVQGEATGRLFFVDPSPVGKDSNAGTFEAPLGTLQGAFDRVAAGDTVFLRGGVYALSRVAVLTGPGGAPGRWITISAYPGETPVIDGRGVLYDASLAQLNPESKWGPPYQRDMGIVAVRDVPGGHVRVQGLQVQNSQRSGISADGVFLAQDQKTKPRPVFLDVSFNTTYAIREMGINLKYWDDVSAIGNRVVRSHSERMVFSVRGDQRYPLDLPHDSPMSFRNHSQEALDLTNNERFEVAYNEVYGGGKEAIDCISVRNGTIHHNLVHSALNGIYIDAWALPIENVKVYRNFIYNAFAGVPGSTEGSNNLINFEIYENIIVNSHAAGIDLSEATYKAKPAQIYGHRIFRNTIHRTGYHADSIEWMSSAIGVGGFASNPDVRDIEAFDNIVTDTVHTPLRVSLPDVAGRRIRFYNNLVWPDVDRLPERYRTSRPDRIWVYERGERLIAADPLYVDPDAGDFRLRAGSPAIGAATDGGDVGALPHGVAWRPGFDWVGRVTGFYDGAVKWKPVFIPRQLFNTFRNHLHRPRFFQEARYGEDLQALPSGSQVFAGVRWLIEPDGQTDIPSVITLAGRQSEAPEANVTGIPIGRKAARLAFLHTAYIAAEGKEAAASTGLAQYRIHYADGTSVDVPIIAGRNIAHWSQPQARNLPEARVAWSIPTVMRQNRIAWTTLYSCEWVNPHPDREIAAVDFLRVGDPAVGTVALFSISTGE